MPVMSRSGFSMVEAMVAAVILSIGVIGVFATMSNLKGPAVESDDKVLAAMAAKQYLEELRSKVDADTYNTPGGPFDTNIAHGPISLGTYSVSYTVTAVGDARRVDLTVTW